MSQYSRNASAGRAQTHRQKFGAAPIASIEDLSMRSFELSPDNDFPRSNAGEII